MDNPATVHEINELTVVASESYKDFVSALQKDISDSLSARPRVADETYFTGKVLQTSGGDVEVTPQLAKQIYKYLLKNDYTDDNGRTLQEAGSTANMGPVIHMAKIGKKAAGRLLDGIEHNGFPIISK